MGLLKWLGIEKYLKKVKTYVDDEIKKINAGGGGSSSDEWIVKYCDGDSFDVVKHATRINLSEFERSQEDEWVRYQKFIGEWLDYLTFFSNVYVMVDEAVPGPIYRLNSDNLGLGYIGEISVRYDHESGMLSLEMNEYTEPGVVEQLAGELQLLYYIGTYEVNAMYNKNLLNIR